MTEDFRRQIEDQFFPHFEISSRDQALFLISERDLEAQLLAIRAVLGRNREADEALASAIKTLDEQIRQATGQHAEHLEDEWVDLAHGSVFQDAAHSMAAVGMLAPFIESLFASIFRALREHQSENQSGVTDELRTQVSQNEFWNPHFVFESGGRRKDLVAGIAQLAKSTALANFLPDDYEKTLSALFVYRNKMFHHGFEWPVEERRKFHEGIRKNGWPSSWFRMSTSNDQPWIFYMSTAFVDHCLVTIDKVLDGVGACLSRQG